jgi:MFS family permease
VFGDGIHRTASAIGFMGTMSGVGALMGSLSVATLSDYRRRTQIQLAAGIGYGLFLSFFAMQNNFHLAIVALVGVGFMSSFFQSLNSTMVMTASDPEYYGRVMSVNMLTFSLMPIGSFIMGYIIDALDYMDIGPVELTGVQIAYFGAGLVITLFVLAVSIFNPSYRKLEQDDLKGFATVARPPSVVAEPVPAEAK